MIGEPPLVNLDWIIGKIVKVQNAFANLWTGCPPKIPIGDPVLAVLWRTTPNKYQLPSHPSLFNTIYRGARMNNLVSLPTSVCILSRPHICQLHKSWNFCFAKTWASEQNLGNLESKVRAGLSCSIWTTGNLRRYHWHINLRSYRSICQILRPGEKVRIELMLVLL